MRFRCLSAALHTAAASMVNRSDPDIRAVKKRNLRPPAMKPSWRAKGLVATFLYASCPAISVPPKVRLGAGVEVRRAAATGGLEEVCWDFWKKISEFCKGNFVLGLRLGRVSLCRLT